MGWDGMGWEREGMGWEWVDGMGREGKGRVDIFFIALTCFVEYYLHDFTFNILCYFRFRITSVVEINKEDMEMMKLKKQHTYFPILSTGCGCQRGGR